MTHLPALNMGTVPYAKYPLMRVLAGAMSYDQAEHAWRQGLLSRREWRLYQMLWVWTALRISGLSDADRKQERCIRAHGMDGLLRRIERAKRLQQQMWLNEFGTHIRH